MLYKVKVIKPTHYIENNTRNKRILVELIPLLQDNTKRFNNTKKQILSEKNTKHSIRFDTIFHAIKHQKTFPYIIPNVMFQGVKV